MENLSPTYTMDIVCSNCKYMGTVRIPKGTMIDNHPCPNCGNSTLHYYQEPVVIDPGIDYR